MNKLMKTKVRSVGRPTKFTKENREKFFKYLRKYLPYSIACRGAGFSYNAFITWYNKGRDFADSIEQELLSEEDLSVDDLEFLRFYEDTNDIEAQIADELIQGYIAESTQGAARRFLLSHRFNPEFGEKSTVEHTGSVDVEVSWKKLVEGDI